MKPTNTSRILLSSRGYWLAATGACWFLAGVGFDNILLTLVGATCIVGLSWCFFSGRLSRKALLVGGTEVRWLRPEDPGDSEGLPLSELGELRTVTGNALTLRLKIRVADTYSHQGTRLTPMATPPLRPELSQEEDTHLLTLTSQRMGDAYFQGFLLRQSLCAGLIDIGVWVPGHFRVTVMPERFSMHQGSRLNAARSTARERSDLSSRIYRGFGSEVRELREHRPGDPFKHIAWRASARRGKLILREFESNLDLSAWVAVDVSPSMFWGAPGEARIDYAMETAYNLVNAVTGEGHRAGLMAFDSKVHFAVKPDTGRQHLTRLTDHLLEIPHLVHETRTEASDYEISVKLAEWLHAQDGIALNIANRLDAEYRNEDSVLDAARLLSVCRRRLKTILEARPRSRPTIPVDAYSVDPHQSLLRALARHAGVRIPLDPVPTPHAQDEGLAAMLRTVLQSKGGPHTVIIISDLYTAGDLAAFTRLAFAARRRRHSIALLCPNRESLRPMPPLKGDALTDAVQTTLNMRIEAHLRIAQAALRPAGVAFFRCGPSDLVPSLLKRLKLAG